MLLHITQLSTLIYLWYLLTAPVDHVACSLWTGTAPDKSALTAACGSDLVATLDRYELQVTTLDGHQVICTRPAAQIYKPECDLGRLDQYRLNLVIPDYQLNLCAMEVDHLGQPTSSEIRDQCDAKLLQDHQGETLQLRYMGTDRQETPDPSRCPLPALTLGDGPYQVPASPDGLATHHNYELLGYRLSWLGITETVYDWQNRFDIGIYNAAIAATVPPRLLKSMMAVESQFWPLWQPSDAGEVGLLQITDAGADVALRYSPALVARYCPQAIEPGLCGPGYPVLSADQQRRVRDAYRRDMQCLLCSAYEAVDKVNAELPVYALTLAAYRCYAGEVATDPATDIWDVTLAVFHAGPGCVKAGICPAGLDYIQKVKQ